MKKLIGVNIFIESQWSVRVTQVHGIRKSNTKNNLASRWICAAYIRKVSLHSGMLRRAENTMVEP